MTERLRCLVPFCHHTRHNREGFSEWICRKHWMMAPQHWRRRYSLFKRRRRPELALSMWARIKRRVIETAVGL